MKKIFFLILVLGCSFYATAQDFQLGKVTLEELQEKVHPKDTSAVAAVLFKKGRTYFTYNIDKGFIANHEVKYRIKIYKKEGLKWATFAVPFYIGYEELTPDVIKFSDAITYNIEQNKIVKTKLNSEGIFVEKINKNWKKASITLPNVKVGSVIEFKYVHKSDNIFNLPEMPLQYSIPVNHFEYVTQIPEIYIYKRIIKGLNEVNTSDELVNGSTSYETKIGTSFLNYKQINTTFSAINIPAIKEEEFVDNLENYTSKICQELERIRYTDKPDKDYSVTWAGVAKTIYKEKDFGEELLKGKYFIATVNNCVEGKTTQFEKMEAVFKHVQGKMNWDKTFGVYVDKGVEKAYESSTGNVAEINFVLINMLNLLGLQASPVLVSTLDHGIPAFPGRSGFNYIIVSVDIDGKNYLLDAANKFTAPNVIPLPLINWTGRLINADGTSKEINLSDVTLSRTHFGLNAKLDTNGNLRGTFQSQKTDFEALRYREINDGLTEQQQIEKIENQAKGLTISNYKLTNLKTDLSKPVIESYDFQLEQPFETIGDKVYVNPIVFLKTLKNPFYSEDRKLPIYFGPAKQEKFVVTIDVPQGYTVEYMHQPIKLIAEDNLMSFSYNSIFEMNKIQVVVSTQVNKVIVSSNYYDMIKDYFQKTIDILSDKIILKKV